MTAISNVGSKRSTWQTTVILTLGFWLSSSLILDLVIMPSLYTTGMMAQAGFATAGYTIFWIFNRIELLCAALGLTGLLVIQNTHNHYSKKANLSLIISVLLLAIALIYTYVFTPQMSALGIQLNLFEPSAVIPAGMNQMHWAYWILEALKLTSISLLLSQCYQQQK